MVLGLSIASPISHLKYMLDVSCLNQFRAPLTFVFAVAAAEIAEREREREREREDGSYLGNGVARNVD